ncbi:MAG: hypothetical protein H6Q19_1556 [Bacteroidetes bacterium]|nr:hypothetical protein [Bacteroidota bacterium]
MAKSKKQKPNVQLLSPENYIRQKARNLPLYECCVNKNWREEGMAEVVVARIHTNGNITFGVYLVDVYCLGVKDSFCNFNQPLDKYEELISRLSAQMGMITIEYALAHNIVFAAMEYAAELGFKACKEFVQTTKFILEEDTDEVELIDIECGYNGKPMFIKTDATTDAQADDIIRQLEKTVGKGNYEVLIADGFDDEDEYGDDDEYENEYDDMDEEERRNLFGEIASRGIENLSYDDHMGLLKLSDSIYINDICDMDEVDYLLEKWEPEIEMDISAEACTPESLGLIEAREICDEDMEELDRLLDIDKDNNQDAMHKITQLRAIWGNIPYLCYLELIFIDQNENGEEYVAKLNEYTALYPDFSLLKMEKLKNTILNRSEVTDDDIDFETIFEGRTAITEYEMFQFQTVKFLALMNENAFDIMQALYEMYDSLEISEEYVNQLKALLAISRINFLYYYFNKQQIN